MVEVREQRSTKESATTCVWIDVARGKTRQKIKKMKNAPPVMPLFDLHPSQAC